MKIALKYYFAFYAFIVTGSSMSYATTYTVTNNGDNSGMDPSPGDGTGTLRQAIVDANAAGGTNTIDFAIGATSTITLLADLPAFSNITINGFSEPGAAVNTGAVFGGTLNATYKITITSALATTLFTLNSSNVIKGLILLNTTSNGKLITINGSSNQIVGCYIGTSGTASGASSAKYGIYINNVANNIIGDGTKAGANVISGIGNYGYGIYITGASATGNTIKGNIIGLQKNGTTLITSNYQLYGVYITSSAASNTVGGTGSEDGNVISGQYGQYGGGTKYYGVGVYINSTAVAGNTVIGNRIGMQKDGATAVASNTQYYGIRIVNSRNNTIGGNSSAHRNVISANGPIPYTSQIMATGILIEGSSSTGNSIKGNYIGLNAAGTAYISTAEQFKGIRFSGAGTGNTIGGTASGEGNVISGNTCAFAGVDCGEGRGIVIENTSSVTIAGNIIGLQSDGNTLLGSAPAEKQYWGIEIDSSSTNNVIGGTTSNAKNIISGNSNTGIQIGVLSPAGCTGNVIKGNIIGLQSDGITVVASNIQATGINISDASSNTIGGSSYNERNIISGNTVQGIILSGNSNTITRNVIGLTKNGGVVTSGSQDYGIQIDAASSNTIGGNSSSYRNYISGNTSYGIYLITSGSSNVIKGNYIGCDTTGTSVLSVAQSSGIHFAAGSSNTIGGTNAGEGNLISGNVTGIYFDNTSSNTVVGNTIGPQLGGSSAMASNTQLTGINIQNSSNNVIGGNTTTTPLARNYISGNTSIGVYINGASSTGNTVYGNYIGTNAAGTGTLGSQTTGLSIAANASSNTIGSGTTGERNIISANATHGIIANGTNSNTIKGNYIGPSATLTDISGDTQGYGILFSSSCESWNIGGTAAGEGNTIAYNATCGIHMNAATVKYIKILRNLIFSNSSCAISQSSVGNETKPKPDISDWSTSEINGTSEANDIIELYINSTGNEYDATEYLGTANADGSGNWSYSARSTRTLDVGEYVVAIATDVSNNTSEIRIAGGPTTLPIELINYTAICNNGKVKLSWATASETNNDFFTIERTSDGINDKKEFIIDGSENSTEIQEYTYTDNQPLPGTSYYRLKQTDNDGKSEYFNVVSVSCDEESMEDDFNVYPNPSTGESINLALDMAKDSEIIVVLYDVNGKETYSRVVLSENDRKGIFAIDLENSLVPGMYTIMATSNNKVYKKRLVIK